MVHDPLPRQPPAGADRGQEVGRALLQNPGTDPVLDVLAAAILEHHRFDPLVLEDPGQREPGRARADDPDLRAHHPATRSNSAAWPWPTPTHSVASP